MQMIKLLFQVSLTASLLFTGCSGGGSEISPSAQVVEESFAPQPLPTIIQIPRRSFQECLDALNRDNSPHKGPDLGKCDLAASDLANADLRFANLMDADLRFAVLKNANLSDAVLAFADLSWADLRRANLSCTYNCALNRFFKLVGADLRGANLRRPSDPSAMPDGSTNDESC